MTQPVLRYCHRGNEVVRLQLMLREVDFTLEPDGIFGPMTREAVKSFQALHALPATGEADPMTWDVLEAAYLQRTLSNLPTEMTSPSGTHNCTGGADEQTKSSLITQGA